MSDRIVNLMTEMVAPRPRRGGWHGGPTPAGAVRGVTAAEAVWMPAPGRKSIWALTLHVAYWNYAVRQRLAGGERGSFPRRPANWPDVPPRPDPAAWRADVALLKAEHARLAVVIRGVPLRRYGEVLPGRKRWTVGELITGVALHDAYHAGQIQMLKRLHASLA